MNYIREINAFYDWLETNTLTDSAINLWHALMHVANKAGWPEEFAVALSTLQFKTGLKKDAVILARHKLQQNGRIAFRSRSGQLSAIYSIVPFNAVPVNCVGLNDSNPDTNTVTRPTQTPTQSATQTPTLTPSINKHKQEETKQENNNPFLPDATENERQILNQLKNIPGYPFDYLKDLEYIRELATDFITVDLLKQSKKYATWLLDNPIKKKSNPRLQFRNWCERSLKFNKNGRAVGKEFKYQSKEGSFLDGIDNW